jgi:hypothetical protein
MRNLVLESLAVQFVSPVYLLASAQRTPSTDLQKIGTRDLLFASGTCGTVPKRIEIYKTPARFAWKRYEDHDLIDESRPGPETKDGFLYYCRLGDWSEHLSIDDAKAWADAQPWGPVTWD